MNNLFDTTPFAYVGNNKYYKDLSEEEKEELKTLKKAKIIDKDELPSSEEVEESSASVVGQMLPQIGLEGSDEPDVDEVFSDAQEDQDNNLLQESKDDFDISSLDGEMYSDSNKIQVTINAFIALQSAKNKLKSSYGNSKISKEEIDDMKKDVQKLEKDYSDKKRELDVPELRELKIHEIDINKIINSKLKDEIANESGGDNDMNFDDVKLLEESLNNIEDGGEIYFEAAGFIEKLKNKFKKDEVTETKKINHGSVMKAAKAYTDMKMSNARLKLAVTRDSSIKTTSEYKTLQKKAISAEKEYRKIKKDLTKDELSMLNEYISGFDSTFDKKIANQIADIKEAKKASIKKESVEVEGCETKCESLDVMTEKDLDPDMKPLIEKLNKKGYKTTSSSSGHNNIVAKDDHTKNGVRDGRLYSDARLVFDGKYDLGKAPKYWYWKKVDNDNEVDYLDIEEISYDTTPGGPSKAFQDWKIKYMRSLTDWVDELPDISDGKKEEKEEVEEACQTESFVEANEIINNIFEYTENDDDDVYVEGANMHIRKLYKTDRKQFKKYMSDIKKCIKNNEYDNARKILLESITLIKNNKAETLKEIDKISDNNILISLCGIALRNMVGFIENLHPTLVFFGLRKVHFLNDFRQMKQKYKENGGKLTAKDINTYFMYIKQSYDKMIVELYNMNKVIDGYEKSYNEKIKTESFVNIDEQIDTLFESVFDNLKLDVLDM